MSIVVYSQLVILVFSLTTLRVTSHLSTIPTQSKKMSGEEEADRQGSLVKVSPATTEERCASLTGKGVQ